ncbi:TonB-dependent receptor [Rhodanobacter sp. AS-Z3]|uniref:TonB-dependent receptor n=1 Tax=Rhodanobacter sp. AS-Z3 TaxID=3031330 RepID=UPI00247B178C|nr:TonB-dependent receptor [Rhodanobacter sp. AS-Z3]WEN15064.1 TonB-dependent receptor [Rhodanobacter sp. AS-Z3]
MTTLSGKTGNGFTYEGEYEAASGGRILWSATFRRDGAYAGVRHGRLHDMQDVATATLDERVQASIESTWTNAT